MTTVVLVDDQELVRDGFRVILDHEPDIEVVGEAADGVEALAVVASADPDVVLLDIRMPRMDGLETLQLLVARGCRARIVVLTTFGLDDYVSKAFGLGASGFLLKNCGRAALVDGVRTVASGDALLAPQLTRRLIEHFVASAPAAPVTDPRTDALSRRELEVLRLIARGLSNAEIAAELFVSTGTVKTHVARMLPKLGVRDRLQAVVLAYELGLVRPGDGVAASR